MTRPSGNNGAENIQPADAGLRGYCPVILRIARQILPLFVPGGIIIAVALTLTHGLDLPGRFWEFMEFFPYVVLAFGLVFGWRFNRSKLIFSLIVLTIADAALRYCYFGADTAGMGYYVFNIVSLLLPINLLLISIRKERGVFTSFGLATMAGIAAQPAIAWIIWFANASTIMEFMDRRLIDAAWADAAGMSQPALAAFVVCFVFLLAGFVLRDKGAVDAGFIWALVALFIGLVMKDGQRMTSFYIAVAGLAVAGAVIETSHGMAFRDELTGLPGRRALNEMLLKMGKRYTIAMVDIDFFKKFNDTYGHDIGDQVLKMVANKLAEVPGGGRAFRYGGEEFTLVFPGKSKKEAEPHMEAVRKAVEDARFVMRGWGRTRQKPQKADKKVGVGSKTLSVTVSIGGAERSEKNPEPEMVIKAADKALYKAKDGGRNRVALG